MAPRHAALFAWSASDYAPIGVLNKETHVTKFWMVFVEGGHGPTYKHESLESAKAEAARLARRCPSCPAYVLEAVERVELPVAWLTLEPPVGEAERAA